MSALDVVDYVIGVGVYALDLFALMVLARWGYDVDEIYVPLFRDHGG